MGVRRGCCSLVLCKIAFPGSQTPGWRGGGRGTGGRGTFLRNKKKDKGEKKVSKQELLKGCHQGQNVKILLL